MYLTFMLMLYDKEKKDGLEPIVDLDWYKNIREFGKKKWVEPSCVIDFGGKKTRKKERKKLSPPAIHNDKLCQFWSD